MLRLNARRNPVTVKKNEQGRDQFYVNDKKWFTSREKAEAWLEANEGKDVKPSKPSASTKPSSASPQTAPAKKGEVIEISDPRGAMFSFSPQRSNAVMYDGMLFPSVEHAFTAIWRRGAADRKALRRAHWDKAMDMRLFKSKDGFVQYAYRMPKNVDVNEEVLSIVRDLLRNRQLADMLLATGKKKLSYAPASDRMLIMRISRGEIPSKKERTTAGMFLGGADQLYARALMQVRDELRSNVFRRF